MKSHPLILLTALCLFAALGVSMHYAQPSSGIELVVNGGFENGWEGWEKYSLDRGYASLDPVDPYDGQYSLAIQGSPTPQAGTKYGSGVHQTIENSNLPLDLDFAFWVKPWFSGRGIVEIKAMLTLHVSHQTAGARVLKILYYVAWLGEVESWANIREDEADYFIQHGTPFSWNYFETSVKDDFEERWGDASGYSLTEIVITFEIVVGYPATNTEYANWDEVSLTTVQMTSTGTGTTSITTTHVTSTPTTRITTASATTGTATTTRSTEENPLVIRPEITAGAIVLILVAAIVALLALRRRRQRAPQTSTRYCMNCGATMPLTAKYCPKCGSSQ